MNKENDIATICLTVDGRPCWHRVRLKRTVQPLVARFEPGTTVDVDTLGVVISSGWGKPPKELTDEDMES